MDHHISHHLYPAERIPMLAQLHAPVNDYKEQHAWTMWWCGPPFHLHAVPMREWNRDALICLKGDLKLNVKVKESGMLDMLEIPTPLGFLNRAEMQAVEAMTSNGDKMDKVIEILLGKEDEYFAKFCDILARSNNEVWANSLWTKAEEFQRRSGNCLQHLICSHYCTYWCYMLGLGWLMYCVCFNLWVTFPLSQFYFVQFTFATHVPHLYMKHLFFAKETLHARMAADLWTPLTLQCRHWSTHSTHPHAS